MTADRSKVIPDGLEPSLENWGFGGSKGQFAAKSAARVSRTELVALIWCLINADSISTEVLREVANRLQRAEETA